MPLAAGTRLGPYEILAPIGAGGMGEVYSALDTKLDREVAVKVLPEAVARDPERLARFEREAKTLASLNHPNIAQVYGFEESAGMHALVMELVRGEPVSLRLPVETALSYAGQIATALEAAHASGIVHRDLKPANVLVTPGGVVKVLDFGLAAVIKPAGASGADVQTITASLTQMGTVMGTPAYMSPEQARGKPVDQRSDIWSFGVLLFEMLTARPLFAGETTSDTIAAVLMRDPDMSALPSNVPTAVRSLLARCLDRDVNRRLSDIGEARRILEHSGAASQTTHRPWIWITAAALVVLLAIAGFLWQRRAPATAAPAALSQPHSIAVLPFVNESGNSEDEYFSDGMTDELASALMKVPQLRVAARSSSFAFKGKASDVREVGQKLHVTSVLEGAVRRAGTKLRITAELVNASDGLVQWSESYERDSKDVFHVQDDIAAAIVGALRLTFAPAQATALQHRPVNPEAHDLYLRGRFFLMKQDETSLRKSLDYFQQALAKDPGYVSAYNGISFAWSWLADVYLAPHDAYPKAKAAALKALELDPSDADAQTMLGNVEFYYEWKWEAGQARFRKALQLNPESADTLFFYGTATCAQNHPDQGLAMLHRAISLDPLSPISSWGCEWCLSIARRFDQVIEQHKRTAELDPDFFYYGAPLAMAYREKGMLQESLAEFEHARRVTGRPVLGMALTLVRLGRMADAQRVLQDFLHEAASRYVAPDSVASVYASLGEKDQAFAWLDKAYEAHSGGLANSILRFPEFDSIRSDPRFAAFIKKMNLEP